MKTLDLGCGASPRGPEGAERYGIDIVPGDGIIEADLTWGGIPFGDESFDRVYAYDFLEHLPKRVWWKESDVFGSGLIGKTRDVHIELFNEVYRVLKPGGVFETFTPHLPNVDEVYRDPTHVSVWVPGAWEYYAGSMVEMTRHYGYTANFRIIAREWRGAHYYVELQKS